MVDRQSDAIRKELHPQARQLAREYVSNFATSLVLQAKILAFRRDAEVVLSSHIEEALDTITKEQTETWRRQLLIMLGSAFFGAFVPGFVTELSAGNALATGLYTVLGFVGAFMVFWGLRR